MCVIHRFDTCNHKLFEVVSHKMRNYYQCFLSFFFQAEDGIRDLVRSRGLGDVYKETDR